MKYIDLIKVLSVKDKEILENYIYTYGINKDNFIGLDDWLQNWSHSNQKLYKLLGEKFIVKIPISYEKTDSELFYEISNNLLKTEFAASYRRFISNIITPLFQAETIDSNTYHGFCELMYVDELVKNQVYTTIKYKKPNAPKILQIQTGSKIMKAIQKVIEYFKDDFKFEDFEQFRITHSIIFNDKKVNCDLCFSIHPLDFLTMSDNNSNWTSCMSWSDRGCYHVGTVEMMNSNNVICCYLENKTPYNFYKENISSDIDKEKCIWTNKKWRCLTYVTKDIIMSGKAYPYLKDEFSLEIIKKLRELAKENLNWTYTFGPELYEDMKYLHTYYSMDRAYNYMKMSPKKHNIIWDTKGMYNDMLNAKVNYWCVRNKVNQNKIISVSGKAPCLCCGDSVVYYNDWYEDYNERYTNTGSVICEECWDEVTPSCDYCGIRLATGKMNNVIIDGKKYKFCNHCLKERVRLCPCCGKIMAIKMNGSNRIYGSNYIDFIKQKEKEISISWATFNYYDGVFYNPNTDTYNKVPEEDKLYDVFELYCCSTCADVLKEKAFSYEEKQFLHRTSYFLPLKEYFNYTYEQLRIPDLDIIKAS